MGLLLFVFSKSRFWTFHIGSQTGCQLRYSLCFCLVLGAICFEKHLASDVAVLVRLSMLVVSPSNEELDPFCCISVLSLQLLLVISTLLLVLQTCFETPFWIIFLLKWVQLEHLDLCKLLCYIPVHCLWHACMSLPCILLIQAQLISWYLLHSAMYHACMLHSGHCMWHTYMSFPVFFWYKLSFLVNIY